MTGGLTHPELLDGPVPSRDLEPDRSARELPPEPREGLMIFKSSESWLEEVGVAVTILLSDVEEEESLEQVEVLMTAMSSSSSVSVKSITSGSAFLGESEGKGDQN